MSNTFFQSVQNELLSWTDESILTTDQLQCDFMLLTEIIQKRSVKEKQYVLGFNKLKYFYLSEKFAFELYQSKSALWNVPEMI